jgi:1-deoxy-D-xylulose-5-phosphate synthase
MDIFPDRAFDVGIAEQHAVTFAAGMATEGMIPFCNIYSTFLQRAYDQVIHDVALQNLPVIFCLDRAGLVGEDGPTHHGVFDIAYLRCIPNLLVFAPRNEIQLRDIMYTAQLGLNQPIAIRYPRGRGLLLDWEKPYTKLEIGISFELKKGSKIAILSTGHFGGMISEIIGELENDARIGHYDFPFIKPLDKTRLRSIFANYEQLITIEDGCTTGGFGSAVLEFINKENITINCKIFGIPDRFITHGPVKDLYKIAGMDKDTVTSYLEAIL